MTDNENAVDTTVDPAKHSKGVDADLDQTGAERDEAIDELDGRQVRGEDRHTVRVALRTAQPAERELGDRDVRQNQWQWAVDRQPRPGPVGS